jgi:hypothetical protein
VLSCEEDWLCEALKVAVVGGVCDTVPAIAHRASALGVELRRSK